MEEMSVCCVVGLSMFTHRRGLRNIFRPLSVIRNTQPLLVLPCQLYKPLSQLHGVFGKDIKSRTEGVMGTPSTQM